MWLALALALLLLAAPTLAQTRVELYNADSSRKGYAIVDEKSGRVDFYDNGSRRTGWGVIRPDGRVDTFTVDGRRLGTVQGGKK